MFTTDAHCDTLYRIIVQNTPADKCAITHDLLKRADIGLQTFAIYVDFARPDFRQDAEKMFALYKSLSVPRIDGMLPDRIPDCPTAVLSVEGGELFGDNFDLLARYDDEIRIRLIALTWNYENAIATPAAINEKDGLKSFGFEFLKEMDRRGICADVSHLNIAGFWDVIHNAKCPPVASHSNCRALCDVPRNLYDDQIKAIIERNGFIGANFYTGFLATDRQATLTDLVRNIDRICELGGENVVGFGTDLDGITSWPDGCGNSLAIPVILEELRKLGYSQSQLEKIAGLNYWRVLKTAESVAGR